MSLNKSAKKLLNKLKTRIWFSIYYGKYLGSKLDDDLVLIESRSGCDLAGNILRITKELSENPDYRRFKLCVSAKTFKAADVKAMLKHYDIENVKMLRAESITYYKYASRAKYLVNDTSFPRRFIKKDGQIILNTWHGTPLKNMGRDVETEVYNMGNVMRNLIFADFLVFPNEYMKEKMIKAYMLENLSKATVLNEGYPRNSIFFDAEKRTQLRQEFGVADKDVIVYMPTWRGQVNRFDTESAALEAEEFLSEMDERLSEDQVMFVKYHPFLNLEIDASKYQHIRPFPIGCEYYEALCAADTLVTDYSSVLYDFANTGRKIVLYVYDKEEYFRDRGVYVSLDEFPFPQANTIDELISAVNAPKDYDDTDFRKLYCTYDSPDAVKRICQRVFLGKKVCSEEKIVSNGKGNVLIYAGDLNKNGITTALYSVLDNIDLEKYNYYLSFRERNLKADPTRTKSIPENVGVIPISAEMAFDFKTARAYDSFARKGRETEKNKRILGKAYKREIERHFYGLKFEHVIHFNGYENNIQGMITQFDAKKTIFVHNDMSGEMELKQNQNEHLLRWAYNVCDNVVTVSEDIVDSTYRISGRKDNIRVISNFHNHDLVVLKGDMPIEFQSNTEIYCPHAGGIKHMLDTPGIKFITIGRFSPEKGHFRLIEAFEIFSRQYPDSELVIIGGTGNLYGHTVKRVKQSPCWDKIAVIKSVQNPMPILKRCDLFILSSVYEGLGLVMLEADSLGVPVFSTDVNGPSAFLKHHGGYLVEDSMEGILQGMLDFADGKIKPMNIDYTKRNAQIRKQLEEIL